MRAFKDKDGILFFVLPAPNTVPVIEWSHQLMFIEMNEFMDKY